MDGVSSLLLQSPSVQFNVTGPHIRSDVGGRQAAHSNGNRHTDLFMFMEAGPFARITGGNYPA